MTAAPRSRRPLDRRVVDVEVGDEAHRPGRLVKGQHALGLEQFDHSRRRQADAVGVGEDHVGLQLAFVDGETRHARRGARRGPRARRWSSARRSTLCSRAYRPPAAMMPAWRMPPPKSLRARWARAIIAALPSSTEPTGAPRPFDRQTLTESNGATMSRSATPEATAALQTRAPSRCRIMPCRSQKARSCADLVERVDDAAAVVVGVLDRHQGRARVVHVVVDVEVVLQQVEVERAVVGVEGARLQARKHGRAALLVFDDVRLGVQEDLVAGRGLGVQRDLVAHGARRHVERRPLCRTARRRSPAGA